MKRHPCGGGPRAWTPGSCPVILTMPCHLSLETANIEYDGVSLFIGFLPGEAAVATIRLVDAAVEYLEKPRWREFCIQPMRCAIGIAADIIIDGVAAQDAVQVQLIDALLCSGTTRVADGLCQTHDQQRMQRGKRDLHIVPTVIQGHGCFIFCFHRHIGSDHIPGVVGKRRPPDLFFFCQFIIKHNSPSISVMRHV